MKSFSLGVLVSAVLICSAGAQQKTPPPKVEFRSNGVTVAGLKPGTHVAWMAVLRERRDYRTVVRVLRGYGPATPNATFAVEHENADSARGIWTVVDVETGAAIHAKSPTMITSSQPVGIRVSPGEANVEISSGAVDVLYVRPRRGAWSFAVADGGGLDADGQQNGVVVMPLQQLRQLKGSPHPPETAEAGDIILVVDPRRVRTGAFEVQP